jgi:GntP family gluconate:H+ symporter
VDAPVTGHEAQLLGAGFAGIVVVVMLIAWVKMNPFLALLLGSGTVGLLSGLGLNDSVASVTKGVGDTTGSVGVLLALGAMLGKILADSGGADVIVDRFVKGSTRRTLPWLMVGVASLVGLPMFFEVGVVLLIPIVLLAVRRTGDSALRLGIPALAGLSAMHGLVPPHPGPLAAIDTLDVDLGLTLMFGIIVAIPAAIIAGPVYGLFIARHVVPDPPDRLGTDGGGRDVGAGSSAPAATLAKDAPPRPSFLAAVATVLLPIALMLAKAVADVLEMTGRPRAVLDVIGTPVVVLLAAVILAMFSLGKAAGFTKERIAETTNASLPPIAGILLIVAAGGGFKQTLIDSGIGDVVAQWAEDADFSPLILGWLVAVLIRVATGSATVATITAAGIVSPLVADLSDTHGALLALAVGSGSLFFSHVNDAGFWLVKEYFGMTVGQTIKSWSVMETILSVAGLLGVLALSGIV